MEDFWARHIDPNGQTGPDYWHYFGQRLVDLATVPEDAIVLDIGTYDGNVLSKAMRKAGPRGRGVGIDICAGGLEAGVSEASLRGLDNMAFAQMDAAKLGFAPDTFHTVLANFVGWDSVFDFEKMRFIAPDPWTAEIRRVLRPGGQVGIGGWVDQSDIEWIVGAIRRHFPERVEKLEGRSEGHMLSYGKENPAGIEVVLCNGGFGDVRVLVETAEFISPDEETWWRHMRQAARVYFEQIPDQDASKRLKEQVFSDLQAFRSPAGIHFSKTVQFAFGTR